MNPTPANTRSEGERLPKLSALALASYGPRLMLEARCIDDIEECQHQSVNKKYLPITSSLS